MINLNVGIICQTLVQQHHLRHVVETCGYTVSTTWLVNQLLANTSQLTDMSEQVDVWLVDVDTFSLQQNHNALLFERWLFDLKQPIIFGEGSTFNATEEGFNSWVRQITEKLLRVSGELSRQQSDQQSPRFVWVLAASTGGPEAVKQFLDNCPGDLGVAFVYVQHIETGKHIKLATTIARDSHYQGCLAEHGNILLANTVTMVPADQQLNILGDGTLVLRKEPWRGQYRPSIDQIVATVAERFGQYGGAIFFSGMGSDGVDGARLLARRGGKVWIQSPATCAVDSMPAAINATGCVSTTGSPTQLAHYLGHELRAGNIPLVGA